MCLPTSKAFRALNHKNIRPVTYTIHIFVTVNPIYCASHVTYIFVESRMHRLHRVQHLVSYKLRHLFTNPKGRKLFKIRKFQTFFFKTFFFWFSSHWLLFRFKSPTVLHFCLFSYYNLTCQFALSNSALGLFFFTSRCFVYNPLKRLPFCSLPDLAFGNIFASILDIPIRSSFHSSSSADTPEYSPTMPVFEVCISETLVALNLLLTFVELEKLHPPR